jgi:tellurite resistance protein
MSETSEHDDLVMRVMIAIAAADDRLVEDETAAICDIYQKLTGATIGATEVAQAMEADGAADAHRLRSELAQRCDEIDMATKETLIRAAYMVLMADRRISARERKKLHDYADALDIPEIHLTAILEDLSSLSD